MTDRQDIPVSVQAGLRNWVKKKGWQQEEPTNICEVFRAKSGDGAHTIGLYDYSNFKDSDVNAVYELLKSRGVEGILRYLTGK